MKLIIDIPKEVKEAFDKADDINFCFYDYNSTIGKAIRNGTPLPKCKDCKHFEYDSVANVDGIPLIVAHEICNRWGDGCKTKEDGYCFLFEADKEQT